MTAINALATDGTAGNRATLTPPYSFRTSTGSAWARWGVVYINSLAPAGGDGYIWDSHRTSNGALNWAVKFRDSANTIQGIYNGTATGAVSVAATTWYLIVETNPGSSDVVTVHVIACPSGTVVGSFTHTGGSAFDDGQSQTLAYGAGWNGSAYAAEFAGRICLMGSLRGSGADKTQAEWQAFAVDPLNVGDEFVAAFGSNSFLYDDSNADISTNGLALTLAGTMAWGSGNGPDIPARDVPVIEEGPTVDYISNGSGNNAIIFDTIFEDELFVEINGTNFLAAQGTGTVYFNTVEDLDGNEVEYTGDLEWSDTLIRLTDNVDIGGLSPGAMYVIVENDDGLVGTRTIEVKSVAADEIGVRGAPAPQTIQVGNSFSFDASKILFRADCQEGGTYSAMSLPTGLSCSAAGTISGTVSHSASATYSTEITLTDPLGASASDQFTMTVLTPGVDPPPDPEPNPGPGDHQPGVVKGVRLADTSRSVGIA